METTETTFLAVCTTSIVLAHGAARYNSREGRCSLGFHDHLGQHRDVPVAPRGRWGEGHLGQFPAWVYYLRRGRLVFNRGRVFHPGNDTPAGALPVPGLTTLSTASNFNVAAAGQTPHSDPNSSKK